MCVGHCSTGSHHCRSSRNHQVCYDTWHTHDNLHYYLHTHQYLQKIMVRHHLVTIAFTCITSTAFPSTVTCTDIGSRSTSTMYTYWISAYSYNYTIITDIILWFMVLWLVCGVVNISLLGKSPLCVGMFNLSFACILTCNSSNFQIA